MAEQGYTLALGQRSVANDGECGQPQRSGELACHAPEQETAQTAANVFGMFGVPCVNVGLVARLQGALALYQPVKESRGLFNLIAGELAAGRGDRLILGARARRLGRTSQVANR